MRWGFSEHNRLNANLRMICRELGRFERDRDKIIALLTEANGIVAQQNRLGMASGSLPDDPPDIA